MAKENLKSIEDVKEYAEELESRLTKRDETFKEMKKIFMMEWDDKPTGKGNLKFTVSPDPRNAALGAIRLMIATDPVFSIPYDKSDPDAKKDSERLEKLASAMWYASSKTSQVPAHYDIVTSGVVFGEAHVAVIDTAAALKDAKGASKGAMKRLERAAKRSPYQFSAINPMEGYPDFDDWGLAAYTRKRKVKGSKILDTWGSAASKVLDGDNDRYEEFTYRDLWDPVMHAVWVEEKDKPIFIGEHKLPVMPIAAQIIDGSGIFQEEEFRRQPFLYTVWKSGLWDRQNLWMTVFYSLLFQIGNGYMWGYEALNPENELEFGGDEFGGYVKWLKGESVKPMINNIFDPNMMPAREIADQKVEESTLFRQALGQPLGGANPSYAMASLFQHAGRLPLVSQQRRGGWLIGQAMEIAFELMRDNEEATEILTQEEGIVSMDPEEIPENLMVDGKLEISLPQDSRMNSITAKTLTDGEDPMVSKAWARDKILNIGQSDEMTKEVWDEKTATLEFMREYQLEMARIQQEMEAMMQQKAGQMQGGGQAPGGEMQPGQAPQQPQQPSPQQPQPTQQPAQSEQQGMTQEQFMAMDPAQQRAIMSQQGLSPEEQDEILAMMQSGQMGGDGQAPGGGQQQGMI